jgi:hypothetical protein
MDKFELTFGTIPFSVLAAAGIDPDAVEEHWDAEYAPSVVLLKAESLSPWARCVFGRALPMADLTDDTADRTHPGWTFETQELKAGTWRYTGAVAWFAPDELDELLGSVRGYIGREHDQGLATRLPEVRIPRQFLAALGFSDALVDSKSERPLPGHFRVVYSHARSHSWRLVFGFSGGQWITSRQHLVCGPDGSPDAPRYWESMGRIETYAPENLDDMLRTVRFWDLLTSTDTVELRNPKAAPGSGLAPSYSVGDQVCGADAEHCSRHLGATGTVMASDGPGWTRVSFPDGSWCEGPQWAYREIGPDTLTAEDVEAACIDAQMYSATGQYVAYSENGRVRVVFGARYAAKGWFTVVEELLPGGEEATERWAEVASAVHYGAGARAEMLGDAGVLIEALVSDPDHLLELTIPEYDR